MMLLAESGATTVWVGERGVRYYAHGWTLTNSSRLVEAQARLVPNRGSRLGIARSMYAMRFPGGDVTPLTMQQLREREGARVRKAYRAEAGRVGVQWARREYDPARFDESDALNQALSAATTCLYCMVHAVVVALGASPALGFVHNGKARSFVFDIADLYKVEIAVLVAFGVAASHELEDVAGETRRRMRDAMASARLIDRCARDVRALLLADSVPESGEDSDDGSGQLWDERVGRSRPARTTRTHRGSADPYGRAARSAWTPHAMAVGDFAWCIRRTRPLARRG